MQEPIFQPLKAESLKEIFVIRFEELILSGKFTIGQKLPSERELALQLGVSRPTVHEGLVELAARGLVVMKPRVGTIVNDYRREGSLSMLTSIIHYQKENLDPHLLQSMLDMRMLMEIETARCAALHRTGENIVDLRAVIKKEERVDKNNTEEVIALDFDFHLHIALATGNSMYPLILNSFKLVYTNFTGQFFKDVSIIDYVHQSHRDLTDAVEAGDEERAVSVMRELLAHGENVLLSSISKKE